MLSDISFVLISEIGNKVARSHANLLLHFNENRKETGDPIGGVFHGNKQILKSILQVQVRPDGRYFKFRYSGRTKTKWIRETYLEEIVVKSFDNTRKSCS